MTTPATPPLPAEAIESAAEAMAATGTADLQTLAEAARPFLAGHEIPTVSIQVEGGEITEAEWNNLGDRLKETWRKYKIEELRERFEAARHGPIYPLSSPKLTERIAELEQLATDILASYHQASDGYRGRVGQMQIAKWQARLAGDNG